MRYKAFAALMISLLVLTGCAGAGGKNESEFLEFRESVIAALVIGTSAEITADYGDSCALLKVLRRYRR